VHAVELLVLLHAAVAAAAAVPAPDPRACCVLFPCAFAARALQSDDEEIPSLNNTHAHNRIYNHHHRRRLFQHRIYF